VPLPLGIDHLDEGTRELFDITPQDVERMRVEQADIEQRRAGACSAIFRLSQADPGAWEGFVAWLHSYTDQEVPLDKAAYGNLLWKNAQRALYKQVLQLRDAGSALASRSSRQEG
jgi:hypothetical protein